MYLLAFGRQTAKINYKQKVVGFKPGRFAVLGERLRFRQEGFSSVVVSGDENNSGGWPLNNSTRDRHFALWRNSASAN